MPAVPGGPAAPRPFDITKYRQRHVALEVMYIGWRYSGLARQQTTDLTIEVGQCQRAVPFELLLLCFGGINPPAEDNTST
jgi:hypothetical protein